MKGRRILAIVVAAMAAVAAAIAVLHGRSHAMGRTMPGGILIGDARRYDLLSGFLLGPFFRGIADDVADVAPDRARVLEVGCGPGHLAIQLARRRGMEVTGLDLDPVMIERARANADRAMDGDGRQPSFVTGDVAALPFADRSFDLVVSTFSMHHWTDPTAGLGEVARVLRPGSRALIWDLRPGGRSRLFAAHHDIPDPVEITRGSPLHLVGTTPWRWPWRFQFAQRIDLLRV